jgi:hypothetical protein
MKSYGALRKVMLIVVLSIIGSYCFGAEKADNQQSSWVNRVVQLTSEYVTSIGAYCSQAWSGFVESIMNLCRKKDDDQVVAIQAVDDRMHGNRAYCNPGDKNCEYSNDFFNDTFFRVDYTGSADLDPTTHYDVDSDPMKLIYDGPQE